MAFSLLDAGFNCLQHSVDGSVDVLPFLKQMGQDLLAFGGEAIKALVAFLFFAPLADEKTLSLESSEERIQSALVDDQAMLCEVLSEGVAVMLVPQLCEDREGKAAASKLEPEVFEDVLSEGHAVPRTLYFTYCVIYSV
jgi:hypothetical protein